MNKMTYQLEMAFIPEPDREPCFFLWLTDEKGNPLELPYPLFETLIQNHPVTQHFMTSVTSPMNTVLLEDEFVDVSGMAVSMVSVFDTLTHSSILNSASSYFELGSTFQYWKVLAYGLQLHIEKGLYYPALFSFANGKERTLFSRWMVSRAAIQRSGQFHQWLQLAPYTLFTVLEMGAMTVHDWQNLLMDTWIDQILREKIQSVPQDLTVQQEDEIAKKWLTHLGNEHPTGIFTVDADPEAMKKVRFLEQHIERLYRPLSGAAHNESKRVLTEFLKKLVSSGFKPDELLLNATPKFREEPFHPYYPWQVKLSLRGKKAGKEQVVDSTEIDQLDPYAKSWLKDKLNHLVSFSDNLLTFLEHQPLNPYERAISFQTILSLHRQKTVLQRLGIDFLIPVGLEWRSIDEDEVSISLAVENNEENPIASSETQTNHFSRSALSLDSLISFDWKIAVGDIELSLQEFKKMVESNQRIVFYQNEWIEIPFERLSEAYNELQGFEADVTKKESRMVDLLRVYIKEGERKNRRVALKIQDQMADYLQKLVSKTAWEDRPLPRGLKGTLRPYQVLGYQWLCGLRERGVGGCLADDMGLGKTIQTIAYLLSIKEAKEAGAAHIPSLIICPTSVIVNWSTELTRFAPSLHQYVHHGSNRYTKEEFFEKIEGVDVIITSFPLFVRDQAYLLEQEWDTAILDEAQMIKNPTTKQSQAVRRLITVQRLALTGTPMENRLEELWSIMSFLNPGYLGSLNQFRSQFITPIERHGKEEKIELVRRLTQPFLLRRTKDDPSIIQDLPEKIEDKTHCLLTKNQASIYQRIVDQLLTKMSASQGIERKGLILSTITRLKQVCNHPYFFTGDSFDHESTEDIIKASGKLAQFMKLIDPVLKKNQKALVFTQYVKTGSMLQSVLQRQYQTSQVFFLHGGIPSDKRTTMIDQFRKTSDDPTVFILSLKAGGVGLNLTEANHVFHFDRWWNPAVENQATDRAYRIGQNQNVHVYKLISKGTLEEGIDQLIEKKKWLTSQVIGSGDRWITEMTDDEVLELVQLREQVTS